MSTPLPVREWRDVSASIFRSEILPAQQPALIRGAVRDWPAVRAATSPQALADYLRGFDTGSSAETMHGDPSIGGRFFYNEDLSGLNFERTSMPLARSLEKLLEMLGESAPPALYVGALAAPAALPGFAQQNTFALADGIVPRLWLSNRVTVQTHYDLSYNLACVVGGRRRFTLFPPEQLANLYVGPLEFTLAASPSAWCGSMRPTTRVSRASAMRSHRPRSPKWNREIHCSSRTCGGTTSKRSTRSTCW